MPIIILDQITSPLATASQISHAAIDWYTMHRGLKCRHRNTSDSICLTHVTKTESLTSCLLTLNQCWYWIPVKAAAANHWQNLIQVYLVIFPWFFASIMLLNGFFYCLFFLIGSLHGCFILKTDIHSSFEFCFGVHQLPGKISGNSPLCYPASR